MSYSLALWRCRNFVLAAHLVSIDSLLGVTTNCRTTKIVSIVSSFLFQCRKTCRCDCNIDDPRVLRFQCTQSFHSLSMTKVAITLQLECLSSSGIRGAKEYDPEVVQNRIIGLIPQYTRIRDSYKDHDYMKKEVRMRKK